MEFVLQAMAHATWLPIMTSSPACHVSSSICCYTNIFC